MPKIGLLAGWLVGRGQALPSFVFVMDASLQQEKMDNGLLKNIFRVF
jgi:hypothetical protein